MGAKTYYGAAPKTIVLKFVFSALKCRDIGTLAGPETPTKNQSFADARGEGFGNEYGSNLSNLPTNPELSGVTVVDCA
jgi:hypothetical protein